MNTRHDAVRQVWACALRSRKDLQPRDAADQVLKKRAAGALAPLGTEADVRFTLFSLSLSLFLCICDVVAVHRKHIKRYYEQWLVCTDPTCRLRTRTDYKLGSKGTIKCRAKKNGATCNNVMNVEVRTPSRLAMCVLNVASSN